MALKVQLRSVLDRRSRGGGGGGGRLLRGLGGLLGVAADLRVRLALASGLFRLFLGAGRSAAVGSVGGGLHLLRLRGRLARRSRGLGHTELRSKVRELHDGERLALGLLRGRLGELARAGRLRADQDGGLARDGVAVRATVERHPRLRRGRGEVRECPASSRRVALARGARGALARACARARAGTARTSKVLRGTPGTVPVSTMTWPARDLLSDGYTRGGQVVSTRRGSHQGNRQPASFW